MSRKAIEIKSSTRTEMVDIQEIDVDEYQRRLQKWRARKIGREWDMNQFSRPVLSKREGGKYVVIDGQHRIEAIRSLYGDVNVKVECDVFDGLSYIEEADIFSKKNTNSKKLNPGEKYHALLEAGDRYAVWFEETAKGYGFETLNDDNVQSNAPNRILVSLLMEAMRSDRAKQGRSWDRSKVLLERMMLIIASAWLRDDGRTEQVPNYVFVGMNRFVIATMQKEDAGGRVDLDRVVSILAATTPDNLLRDGRQVSGALDIDLARAIATVIIRRYNKRLADRNRLDES